MNDHDQIPTCDNPGQKLPKNRLQLPSNAIANDSAFIYFQANGDTQAGG